MEALQSSPGNSAVVAIMDGAESRPESVVSSPASAPEDASDLAIMQLQDAATDATNEPPRTLPDKDITAETLEDAYVQFIWYCNPTLASTYSTDELRRGFASVPRADGKTFQTWALFELVRRLERGEIATWNILVVELGVEKPDTSKGQSGQKLGQYAVRLKKWMHAYHLDAFFQYILGRPNEYYTHLPTNPDSTFTEPRDGIPPEEDLALRALVPYLRPKRGRRREHERENWTPKKRARTDKTPAADDNESHLKDSASTAFPSPQPSSQPNGLPLVKPSPPRIAYPQSAYPMYNYDAHMSEVWASAQRAFMGPNATPSQPSPPPGHWPGTSQWSYPHSAIDPQPPSNPFSVPDGSQSAHPNSSGSSIPRKRPGSSVSAAWPTSSSSGTAGRFRGRPGRPSRSRVFQAGPYSAFATRKPPTDTAATAESPAASGSTPTPTATAAQGPSTSTLRSASGQKPSKLSLQVPQQPSGNVRLATPPPKVVVNGEDAGGVAREQGSGSAQAVNGNGNGRRTSADFFDILDEESDGGGDAADERGEGEGGGDEGVDWKRRALILGRKFKEAQAELRAVKRRVMEAVM